MPARIDRAIRIARALREAQSMVAVETWEHDNAALGELVAAVAVAVAAAEAYVTIREGAKA